MILGAVIAAGAVALVVVPALAGVALLVAAGAATMRRTAGRGSGAGGIASSVGPSDDRWRRFTAQVGQLDDDVDSERRTSPHDEVVQSPAPTANDAVGSRAESQIERVPIALRDAPIGTSDHRFEGTSAHHPEPGMAAPPVGSSDNDWPSVLPHEQIGDTGPLAALPPSHDREHRQAS